MNNQSFEEFRNREWGSIGNMRTPIKDLDASHLVNILNWIDDHRNSYPAYLYGMFEQEAKYRRVLAFSSDEPMPVKQGERWTLDNIDYDIFEEKV
jgi:hypothetical protein